MTVHPDRCTPGTRVLVQHGRWTTRAGTIVEAAAVDPPTTIAVDLDPTDRYHARRIVIPGADVTPFCPDGGACHHTCPPAACFRVRACGPLSGVYPGDVWPADVTAEHAPAPTYVQHLVGYPFRVGELRAIIADLPDDTIVRLAQDTTPLPGDDEDQEPWTLHVEVAVETDRHGDTFLNLRS